jgi:hypothetical protein
MSDVTKLQEEKMGRNHKRLVVWALAILTCVMIFGEHTAYAWDHANQARVMAGGQFFIADCNPFTPPPGCNFSLNDRVSFGVNARCETGKVCSQNGITPAVTGSFTPVASNGQAPKGTFEYFNHQTGMHAHGKITDVSFGTASSGCMFASGASPGTPAAIVQGTCKDGSCTQFQMELLDGDDGVNNVGDWVCNVTVSGANKTHGPESDQSQGQQLIRGDIEIRNTTGN